MEKTEINNVRVTRDSEEREEIIDLFRESGLSKAQFARDYGIRYKTFCSWFKAENPIDNGTKDNSGALFYEVECDEVHTSIPVKTPDNERLEIYYPNGVIVKVPNCFEVEKVSALVKGI